MKNISFIFAISSLFFLQSVIATTLKLSNGAPVIYENNRDIPRSIIVLNFEGGPANLTVDEQGIVLLLEEALRTGPSSISKEEFYKKLFYSGIDFDFFHGPNLFQIIVKVPKDKIDDALILLKNTIDSPKLSEKEFNEYYSAVMTNLTSKFEDMRQTIFYFAARDSLSYSPYSMTGDTSPESLKKITISLFKEKMNKLVDFSKFKLAYVGELDSHVVIEKFNLHFSSDLAKAKFKKSEALPSLVFKKAKKDIVLIDKPGATDNQLAFMFYNNVKRDTLDFLNAKTAMDLLGGGLHGQLGRTLRTERGLTYAAMSWFSSSNYPLWMVWTFGGNEQVKGLLAGVPEVLDKFKKLKISKLEVEEAKERLLNEHLISNELTKDRLAKQMWYANNRLNFDFHKNYQSNLMKVSDLNVKKFIQKLKTDKPLIYIMGDRQKLLKALTESGYTSDRVEVISINDIR